MILFSYFRHCFYLPNRNEDESIRIKKCAKIFCCRVVKALPKTVTLMKEDYKEKCFSESTIFRWQGDLKKGCLSVELICL